MGAMLAEGGKTLAESDPEVSEAIDFCRFYADSAKYFHELPGVTASGRGVVVVVSPWNFPLAIPCGGVAAALAAGNNVILKPASDTVLIAYELCQCFWRAGVPKTALQFAPCSGGTVGARLVAHEGVDAVILTGGTETAAEMLRNKPTMHLLAETGGKNATIVTALSDRDQAIKNVLHSAFSHSGQKCSATSLLILESEVYHDASFRATLCDAVESLSVGSAWELPTKIGPLIRPPSGALETGLKELEPGEEWAVMPRLHVDDNPHLVSPGVKWGVQANSFTHCTELFGPVLGVMEARDLDDAIDLVNATGYGLTSGLESLDDREQELWCSRIRAGNLYINRPTTGAIVLRQPFGGMGKSSVGPGIKAGGPNYVVPLMQFKDSAEDHSVFVIGRCRANSSQRAKQCLPFSPRQARRSRRPELLQELVSGHRRARRRTNPKADGGRVPPRTGGDHQLRALGPRRIPRRARSFSTARRRQLPPLSAGRAAADSHSSQRFAERHLLPRRSRPRRWLPGDDQRAADRFPGQRPTSVELLDQLTDSWAGAIEFIDEDDEALADAIRIGQGRTRALRRARSRARHDPHRRRRIACSTSPIRRFRCTAASSCCGTCASRACRTFIIATAISDCGSTSRAMNRRDLLAELLAREWARLS